MTVLQLHTIATTDSTVDGPDYEGRTFGCTVFGFRVCIFVGRRQRWSSR